MPSELTSFSFNIQKLRKRHGLSQADLAAKLDVARTTIGNWEKGVSYPLFEDLIKLANSFDVTLNDLVSPVGGPPAADAIREMGHRITSVTSGPGPKKGMSRGMSSASKAAEPAERYRMPKVVTVSPDGEPNIVMLDAQAAAGLPANVGVAEFYANKPVFRIPGARYRGGTMVAIQVSGDSMEPTVGHNDWLIARFLEDPLTMLHEGYLYVLVAKDGVVAKRLFRAPGGQGFICRSDNEMYPAYEIGLGDALQVWKVEAVLSEDLSNKGADIRERLARVERDIMALQRPSKRG